LGQESFYEDEKQRKWFITGDIAMMDQEGLVYIFGRKKDKIIGKGGKVIMPSVMESCLEKFTNAQVRISSFIKTESCLAKLVTSSVL